MGIQCCPLNKLHETPSPRIFGERVEPAIPLNQGAGALSSGSRLMAVRKRVLFLLPLSLFWLGQPLHAQESVDGNELEALLEADEMVEISSQVPGIVDEILVERGDLVKKGQVLARLMSGVERANIDLIQAQVEFGERKVSRNDELQKKMLISVQEKDEMETEARIAKLQLAESRERLRMRTIESPVSGVVVKRSSSPGEYVGEASTMMTIVKLDPLNVEVVVPVRFFGKIRKSMQAKVYPEQPIGGEYTAQVTIVDPLVDAASGTFGVRMELANPSRTLPAGLRCKVRFPVE